MCFLLIEKSAGLALPFLIELSHENRKSLTRSVIFLSYDALFKTMVLHSLYNIKKIHPKKDGLSACCDLGKG